MAENRNYGLDLLKIVAMFFVLLLHVLLRSGINNNNIHNWYFILSWFLEIIAFCGVDVFAIVTGYVSYGRKFKINNIISIWIRLIFYSYIIFILFFLFKKEYLSRDLILNSVFPVLRGYWWYISAYIAVQFFIPFINSAVEVIDDRKLKTYAMLMLIPFSILNILRNGSSFSMEGGYSALWLLFLYIVGAILRKTDFLSNLKIKFYCLIFLISTVCTFILKYLNIDKLIGYTSPTIFLNAICFFMIFKKINIVNEKTEKIICFFSKTNLDVYIIHLHPVLWSIYWAKLEDIFSEFSYGMRILLILVLPLIIYVLCSLIGLVRLEFFKLIKIDNFCLLINKKIFKEEF